MQLHRLTVAPAIALAVCSVNLPPAAAQTAPPRDAAAASRAARDAENPMRVIIEASKIKPRAKPAATEAPAPEKRVVPAPKPAAARAVAPVAKSAGSAVTVSAAASQPPIATPEVQTVAKAVGAAPVAAMSPAPAVQALPAKPLKLMQLVEPSLPGGVLRRMRNDVEVVVGFTVKADGTVSDVQIRSNPMKSLDASVVEAVAQWRYEPIHEARSHAVQLVLRASP